MIYVLAVGLCLVASSDIGSVKSSVTVSRSSVVLLGEAVELKCSVTVNDVASWKFTSWNSSRETAVYLGRDIITSMRSRYKIDKNISGQHNLIIDSVDLAHAGRYRCIGVKNNVLVNDVQLIVLGSHPVCSGDTSEADVATEGQRRQHLCLWCSVNYTGNGFPVFIWTKSSTEKNITANTTISGTGRGPITNTSSITQQLRANDSGVKFYCRITFQTPSTSKENAINDFQYKWNYTCCAKGSGVTSDFLNSSIRLTPLAIAGPLLIIIIALACVVYRKTLRGDSNVRPEVALNTDLNAYGPAGHVNSDNEVYTDVCNTRGSSGGVNSDNEIYSEVCDRRGSDTTSDNEVYAEVCEPKGPSNVSKGTSIGDNSRSPQIPTRERKDLIGADGTEHVELREVKPPDRKGGRYMKSVMW